ncbi:hypothetical protein AGOR_G00160390 [Albula goreensis]|uniref:Uncharacterized protein n=1 Tax=Albula goreensis TaxID=1534307 RepID=A0A8T3D5V6_9TELE|nr:hypothetical protein AGOR_G00160390 [Albula goreensis]
MSIPRTLGELQLYRVLQRANLLAYYATFIQQGGDDVQQLCEAGEEEFLEIMALVGMATKPLHVRRLQKALRDWTASPTLFNQPPANISLNGVPVLNVEAASGTRRSLSNGQPGSPSDSDEQASPIALQNESEATEEQFSPAPSTPPSTSSSQALAWPGGRLDPETTRLVRESVEKLLHTVSRGGAGEAKSLLRPNRKLAKILGHIFDLEPQDPSKEEEIRKYSLIYGRFDSKRREGKQLTQHEMIINEAAAQFCIHDNALLLRRVELFSLARQVARECAYTSTLRSSRKSLDDSSLPPQKRIKQEENGIGSECVHQGALRPRGNEDSSSGESHDGLTPDVMSQPCQSPSSCPAPNTSGPPSWSRHLVEQMLVDEGLRVAGLVSHDQVGKVTRETGGIRSAEPEDQAAKDRGPASCFRQDVSCGPKEDPHHRRK